jgi:hypothetical protein
MITIIGGLGAIGSRYVAILRQLGVEHNIVDTADDRESPEVGDSVLIATPTPYHIGILHKYSDRRVLCEKPVSLRPSEIEPLLGKPNLRMVSNWRYLPGVLPAGHRCNRIHYDYFYTGKELQVCNMAQPYFLADHGSTFRFESTVFRLTINGEPVTTEDVQRSYVLMISDWLLGDDKLLWTMADARDMAKTLSTYPSEMI